MGKELTQLSYVNCPSCLTMFKPRVTPRKLTDNIYCFCCGKNFNLKQSVKFTKSNKKARANQKSLPVTVKKSNKKTTESYLRSYKIKSKALLFIWISIPFALLSLITTSVYEYKDELAQTAEFRPYIEKFCAVLNCSLPTYSNLDYLQVEDNAIVSSKNKEKSIQLFAMISNVGTFDQKYPNLKIKFTDINDNVITYKTISPNNYIKDYNTQRNILLAKNSKEYISMTINDPGPKATNYEIMLQ